MIPTFSLDTSQFNRAMDELIRISGKTDQFIIFKTAGGVIRNLVRFTTLFKGLRGKMGRDIKGRFTAKVKSAFTEKLEQFIERKAKGRARLGWWRAWIHLRLAGHPQIGNGPLKDRGEGGIIDRSGNLFSPSITVFNEVPYIGEIDEKKKTLQRGVQRQLAFLNRAIDNEYTKMLRGKSAR